MDWIIWIISDVVIIHVPTKVFFKFYLFNPLK